MVTGNRELEVEVGPPQRMVRFVRDIHGRPTLIAGFIRLTLYTNIVHVNWFLFRLGWPPIRRLRCFIYD